MNNLKLVAPDHIPIGEDCTFDNLAYFYKLALLMEEVCEEKEGIGLSAVQVGVPLNFFIVKFGDSYRYFANCVYDLIDDVKEKSLEGCLSLRTESGGLRHFEVDRFSHIRVTGKELLVYPKLAIGDFADAPEDFYKVVFQHEIDHAKGVLISQIGREVFLWKK